MPEDSKSRHDKAMAEVRRVVAEAKELSGAADGALTDHLATWIAGRYAIATRQLALENGDGTVDWNLLRALCHDLVDLRRGDHSAESLRIERERLEMEKAEAKEDLQTKFREWADENRENICAGFTTQAKKIELLGTAMFGEEWRDKPDATPGNGNGGPVCPAPDGPPPAQENAK
jgi:hypothetical protein